MGGSRFGARAFAGNPEEEALLLAIDYAHLHGRSLYLTVNTLMKDSELSELEAFLTPYYVRGVDAVIVQDLGVFSFLRKRFPDLPLHVSTQMTITGPYGAGLLKELGAERVVLARELSLAEIAEIHRETDVELECFVHGALCYCYSGQCLFSSLIGGRSGNRGRCAQTCRLPYSVRREGTLLNGEDSRYVLSLKDLCTLDLIPDMIEAGIYSLKIEGRMKSPRYTAGVTELYRRYADLYLERGRDGYRVEADDRRRLLELFDRGGQTDGYYKRHNGKDMVVWKEKPGFREGNQELLSYLDRSFVDQSLQESVTGTLSLKPGEQASLTVSCGTTTVSALGDVVQAAVNQPMYEAKVRMQMEKTGNTPFYFDALSIELAGAVFLPVQSLKDLRRRGLQSLEEALTERFYRSPLNVIMGDADKGQETGRREDAGKAGPAGFPPVYASLERPDCLAAVLCEPQVKRIYLDSAGFEPRTWKAASDACHAAGKACMLAMPHIFRSEAETFFTSNHRVFEEAGFDGVLIRSLEEIGYLRLRGPKLVWVLDYGVYGMNQAAADFLLELGARELTWPVELNRRELSGLSRPGELIIYGRIPMMVTAQCLHSQLRAGGCDRKPETLMLKDRMGKEFPVKNHCTFCYNTIYNTAPISLLGLEDQIEALAPSAVRLQFTVETPEATKLILDRYMDGLLQRKTGKPLNDFTRGHFKRGVE